MTSQRAVIAECHLVGGGVFMRLFALMFYYLACYSVSGARSAIS